MVRMLDYIEETKDCLLNIIDNSQEYTAELVKHYIDNNCDGLYFVASGSSYNGTLCAKDFMQHIFGENISLVTPFTFLNHEKEYIKNQMIIGVSQSGCSTNTLDCLAWLKQNGHKTVCLVGRDDCDAKNSCDLTVNWKLGEEKIGFVTKGVSALACFEMVFVLELAKAKGIVNDAKYEKVKANLRKSQQIQPEMMKNTIEVFNNNKEAFLQGSKVIILSSGPNFGTATEAALKIAETSCITTLACEAEEFLHGPIYASRPDDLVIVIDNNDDPSSDRLVDIANAIRANITPKVFAITNSKKFNDDHAFRTTDQTCLHISPLYKLTCIQTLACLMTEATNNFIPHQCVLDFKKSNSIVTKSRENLFLNLQEGEKGE